MTTLTDYQATLDQISAEATSAKDRTKANLGVPDAEINQLETEIRELERQRNLWVGYKTQIFSWNAKLNPS